MLRSENEKSQFFFVVCTKKRIIHPELKTSLEDCKMSDKNSKDDVTLLDIEISTVTAIIDVKQYYY